MIKHNAASSVISPFNPIVALRSHIRLKVNTGFIEPKIKAFFDAKLLNVADFEAFDVDKLRTEVEFNKKDSEESYVKTYIYRDLMSQISKDRNGKVNFKPRYVISFDKELTNNGTHGELRLGSAVILYMIYIDLQELIQFIKKQEAESENKQVEKEKITETPEIRRNKLIAEHAAEKFKQLLSASDEEKDTIQQSIDNLVALSKQPIQGNAGKLRVNLSWLTTDDLDLHIVTPNGEICYNNKSVEHEGVIGVLDIDANAGNNLVSNPQENINFDVMPKGKHTIFVNFYADREGKSQVPFTIWIDNGDDSKIYDDFIKKSDGKKEIVYFQYENGISEFTLPNTSY